MKTWRNSRATLALVDELDDIFPKRSRRSDGTKGDAAHAARTSDHNPWVPDPAGIVSGVVTAVDLTDDDLAGADMRKLVHWLTTASRDPRIKYLIHEGKIYSSYKTSSYPAWAARPYSGPNGHFKHLHVSVNPEPHHFDNGRPWGISAAFRTPAPTLRPKPFIGPSKLRLYSEGQQVKEVQRRTGGAGAIDGIYGPRTAAAVRAFQKRRGLPITGIVDQDTARRMGLGWKSLK